MSAPRGRVIRGGGMAVDPQGATARTTQAPGEQPITRPAFRTSPGGTSFAPTGVGGANPRSLLDLSAVPAWRLIAVAAAALWLGIVWVNLRGGISGGVRL